jgi:hypothetical protein
MSIPPPGTTVSVALKSIDKILEGGIKLLMVKK